MAEYECHKESMLRISQLAVCRFALFWEQFDVRSLLERLRQVSVAGDLIDENARRDRKINLVRTRSFHWQLPSLLGLKSESCSGSLTASAKANTRLLPPGA
jgi:hypothetical protein